MTVLALTIARVLWRLTHRPPPLSDMLATWERKLAHTVHGLFYVSTVLMPLVGWSIISAHPPRAGQGPAIWGVIRVPPIAPISHLERSVQHAMHRYFVDSHTLGGWLLLGLVALHVGGALKHQFHDRQPEFPRMGIGGDAGQARRLSA
jgi:cytochrome b561